MSRQQTRSSGDGAIDPSLVQKKRARHRLVGAICLSLIAAIVVPLVLESEPRPRDWDLPIELAGSARGPADGAASARADANAGAQRAGAAASSGSAEPARGTEPGAVTTGAIGNLAATQTPAATAAARRNDASASDPANTRSAVKAVTPPGSPAAGAPAPPIPAAAAAPPAVARQQPRQDLVKPSNRGEPAPPPLVQDKPPLAQDKPPLAQDRLPTRAGEPDVLARLIERADPAAGSQSAGVAAKTASRKFLVQIGAYSNVQSARSVLDRAVQVGLRPYQETVKTAQGDWIRVRVGPFASRQDAERAQQDLKRAGVTAAIIAL
ncbi:MAG: SPOR domain-containing protein [Lautropia sp.]|nr:SPOR domain-containing protein [Lautropia sp.]